MAIVGGGACVVVVGGIVMKGGCCYGDPPVCMLVPPPLSVCLVAVLNGGVWCVLRCPRVCCDAPVFGLGMAPCVVRLSCVVLFSLVLSYSPLHHPTLRCVCCHGIVDSVVCLCVRVVSLLNGGGVCVVVVSIVCAPFMLWWVLWRI